jgi:hypothetical protein
VVERDLVSVGDDEVVVTEAEHRSGQLERLGGWLPDAVDRVQPVESEDASFVVKTPS